MTAITTDALLARMRECRLPPHMHEGLLAYIQHGRPVGHFLTAILSNDLMEACGRADGENRGLLWQYGFFLYNYAPRACYGSAEKVAQWIAQRGLEAYPELVKT